MDDLAPAPAQRTTDNIGRTSENALAARKKVARKVPPALATKQDPEPELDPGPEEDHQLDVLG
jgi:hypothetical protein